MSIVLAGVAVGAALACPAHMLWRMRRGKPGRCLPMHPRADAVAKRQAHLAKDLARVAARRG